MSKHGHPAAVGHECKRPRQVEVEHHERGAVRERPVVLDEVVLPEVEKAI